MMMDKLVIKVFETINIIDHSALARLDEHMELRHLKKGEFFIQAGEKCKEIAFVNSGMLRSYYLTESGEDFTYCVRFEHDFMSAYSSYITGQPAVEYIQALVDTELYIIQKSFIEAQAESDHNTSKLMRFFAEQYIIELELRVFSYQKENAKKRYEYMLENHPKYLSEIPLQHLASYLGITQRHLSRIRKDFNH
jgi:CRP-like cAMP-binding protein